MSWLGGYKANKPSNSAQESREEKRERLLAERIQRAQRRAQLQQQLKSAQESRLEADKAIKDLLALDPHIFESGSAEEVSVSEDILDEVSESDNASVQEEVDQPAIMAEEFDVQNDTDGDKALSQLQSAQCPFSKSDIDFWFCQLESQLELIEVKSQWMKRMALLRFLLDFSAILMASLLGIVASSLLAMSF